MLPSNTLVSTAWLEEHLNAPDVRIADASWYLPGSRRDAKAEYRSAHIPHAVFFDIEDLSDETSDLPHMLPSLVKFSSRMRKLGLGDGNLIVVYDGAGIYSSPRAWWMMRAMGHEDVVVLDGGLPKWRREGRFVEDLVPNPMRRHFTPRPNRELVRTFDDVFTNLSSAEERLVDARSRPRFRGAEQEPRPGVQPGHIPGSANVYYADLITPEGTLKGAQELRRIFAESGVDPAQPIVTTCGSGITAAIDLLALTVIGAKNVALYDGSWAEWGARSDAPKETA